MIIATFITLLSVIVFLCIFMYELERTHQEERETWHEERKELLDRIQAPSFAEYKHQEVRVMKAQKEEKKSEQNFFLE
jgi:hypothetical protein